MKRRNELRVEKASTDERYIKLQALEELRQALRIKKINEDLLELLNSTLVWLVRYCDKNHLPLDYPKLEKRLKKIQELITQLPISNEILQRDKANDDLTEYGPSSIQESIELSHLM